MKTSFYIFTLFLLICMPNVIFSQSYLIAATPINSQNCVYLNQNGEKVIETNYSICYDFNEDGSALASTDQNEKFYLFDSLGNLISHDSKLDASVNKWANMHIGFSNGILRMRNTKKKWGAINSVGLICVPFEYDNLTDYRDGFAIGKKKGIIYIIDKQGKAISLEGSNIISYKPFSEGLAPVKVYLTTKNTTVFDELWGFIDSSGKLVVEPQFLNVGYFSGGIAWARALNRSVGYINMKGEWIIEPKLEVAFNYDQESGLARVKLNSKWGYIDTLNNFKTFYTTERLYDFSEGLAIGRIGYKVGYVNNKGEWVIPAKFQIAQKFKNGAAKVKIDDKWGLIDKNGNWILTPEYEKIGNLVRLP